MAVEKELASRPDEFRRFEREVPRWFLDAKLGIFVHWGPYSVPAWAEPIGELGTIDQDEFWRHNPYAEWYANTSRIEGSGAHRHQEEAYGGAPYDEFIDAWRAERFDPDELLTFFASTGARYFVPTTKHHDGVTLWDAPHTGDRNTFARGPRRDLINDFAVATRKAGLRFGTYYSGGLDWHFTDFPPIDHGSVPEYRPRDASYARYAYDHVVDLIERFEPDILWGDIEWPDAGKAPGEFSLINLFDRFYKARPDGVVNDRFGDTHWDFRTSEYQLGGNAEGGVGWENSRGIGYSYGYNQLETAEHYLTGPEIVGHFVDVVSRGGNFLLNVGLTASGQIPALQRTALEYLRDWNARNGHAIFGSSPAPESFKTETANPIRWTLSPGHAHAFVEDSGVVSLPKLHKSIDTSLVLDADGSSLPVWTEGGALRVGLPQDVAGPILLTFKQKG